VKFLVHEVVKQSTLGGVLSRTWSV